MTKRYQRTMSSQHSIFNSNPVSSRPTRNFLDCRVQLLSSSRSPIQTNTDEQNRKIPKQSKASQPKPSKKKAAVLSVSPQSASKNSKTYPSSSVSIKSSQGSTFNVRLPSIIVIYPRLWWTSAGCIMPTQSNITGIMRQYGHQTQLKPDSTWLPTRPTCCKSQRGENSHTRVTRSKHYADTASSPNLSVGCNENLRCAPSSQHQTREGIRPSHRVAQSRRERLGYEDET